MMTESALFNYFEKQVLPEVDEPQDRPNLYLRCQAWNEILKEFKVNELLSESMYKKYFDNMPEKYDTLVVKKS